MSLYFSIIIQNNNITNNVTDDDFSASFLFYFLLYVMFLLSLIQLILLSRLITFNCLYGFKFSQLTWEINLSRQTPSGCNKIEA